jgi:lipopolysaccharide biosynthesis regulator YciM
MLDLVVFILLFVALAIGWLLGRRSKVKSKDDKIAISPIYFKGLSYLFYDEPDESIDSFIHSLDVTSDTLETHLALGNLLRRKGEVDRAIKVHQNLLARPMLSTEQQASAHMELALDYMAAGLLDRAERLLLDLVKENNSSKDKALKQLLNVYVEEREWESAIDTAKKIQPKRLLRSRQIKEPGLTESMAHFSCELAVEANKNSDFQEARRHIKRAYTYDKHSQRAGLMTAQLDYDAAEYTKAIATLQSIPLQNAAMVSGGLKLLIESYNALDDKQGLIDYLTISIRTSSSMAAVLVLAKEMEQFYSREAAMKFLAEELKQRPSLKGLNQLVAYSMEETSGKAKENLLILQQMIRTLIKRKPTYKCQHCGFPSKIIFWQCPSCKNWGSMELVVGVEGD